MTKQRALVLAYACTVPISVCWELGQYVLVALFILLLVVLLGLWAYKDMRDNEFIAQAKQERDAAPETTTLTTRKKNPGLFVPQPLDHHE